jgi:tight adherence protein B
VIPLPPPAVMQPLAIGAGTLAVLVAVLLLATPVADFLRDRWRAYEKWADTELRALYSPLRARQLAWRHAALVAVGVALGALFGSWLYGLLLAAACAWLPVVWLERQRRQRKKALDAQLDATLQSMANTILVTQNLEDAFATIAQHFAPPIAQEADILVKQVRLGTPMDEALRDFAARCQSRNVDAIVTALTVGRQTGGELPKVLETTATVLRETVRVEGVMESKTSEGKAQVVVMGLMPIVFGGALQVIDPEWMQPLFKDPVGWGIILVACLLEAVGLIMVRRLSRLDV